MDKKQGKANRICFYLKAIKSPLPDFLFFKTNGLSDC